MQTVDMRKSHKWYPMARSLQRRIIYHAGPTNSGKTYQALKVRHVCCAVLCCAVLCCAVLCCAVLCCAVLCCAVLCCAKLICDVMHFSVAASLCVLFRGCSATVMRMLELHLLALPTGLCSAASLNGRHPSWRMS